MTIYNVLINSNNRVAGGTTTSSANYYFNWGSVLPEGAYLLRWGFTSSNVNTMINKIAVISVNLGQSSVYTASSSSVRASTTNIIGSAISNESDLSSFLYGDSNTNNIVFLSNAPSVNEFTVTITDLAGNLWTDAGSNPLPEYMLALNFEKI
jgi:hypothetical protein